MILFGRKKSLRGARKGSARGQTVVTETHSERKREEGTNEALKEREENRGLGRCSPWYRAKQEMAWGQKKNAQKGAATSREGRSWKAREEKKKNTRVSIFQGETEIQMNRPVKKGVRESMKHSCWGGGVHVGRTL